MNRYKFSRDNIEKAIQFLQGKTKEGPTFATRFKDRLVVKKKKLFFEEKEVVPREDVDEVLRREIYKIDGDICAGRDAAFHGLKKKYIGIGRRPLMTFLRAQKPLGEVRNALPKPKQKSGKKLKTYVFEADLVFLKKNDLVAANPRFELKDIPELAYILTTTEKITGLSRFSYSTTKHANKISKIVIEHCEDMAKELKSKLSECELFTDAGTEFSQKLFTPLFQNSGQVPTGVHVENKNAQLQKTLFRVLRQRKAKTVKSAIEQSEKLLNNQFNRIHRKTPNELVERGDKKKDILEYNKKRVSYIQGDKRKQFEVGTYVRMLIKDVKPGIDYKSYKNKTFSRQVYIIEKVTKKSNPRKYYVKIQKEPALYKWFTQDKLLKSSPRDEISNELVEERDMTVKQKEAKAEKKHIQERYESLDKEEPKRRRSKRESAEEARVNMLERKVALAKIDNDLVEEEIDDEKKEIAEEKTALQKAEKKLGIVRKSPKKKKKSEDVDPTTKYRTWLKRRGLPFKGDIHILKKRVILKKKIDALKKKVKKHKKVNKV